MGILEKAITFAAEKHNCEELQVVKKNNKYGFIDKSGHLAIPPVYDFAKSFREGVAAVIKNDKYGFIDKSGKVVISFTYDGCDGFFDNGLAKVRINDKWGYINCGGNEVIPFVLRSCDYLSEGMVKFHENGKWGYFDESGKLAIPAAYDFAEPFSEGVAEVGFFDGQYRFVGKSGFIDKTGFVVIPIIYDRDITVNEYRNPENHFDSGIARVRKNGKFGYINKNNEIVVPIEYDIAFNLGEGIVLVSKGGYWSEHITREWDEYDMYSGEMDCINTNNGKIIFKSVKFAADNCGMWYHRFELKDGFVYYGEKKYSIN